MCLTFTILIPQIIFCFIIHLSKIPPAYKVTEYKASTGISRMPMNMLIYYAMHMGSHSFPIIHLGK